MANPLQIIIKAALDEQASEQQLQTQLNKIRNLKVNVSANLLGDSLRQLNTGQTQMMSTIQQQMQQAQKAVLTQAKATNREIESDYRASQQMQTAVARTMSQRRIREMKAEEAQAKAINKAIEERNRIVQKAKTNRSSLSDITGNSQISNSNSPILQEIIQHAQELEKSYSDTLQALNNPKISTKEYDSLINYLNHLNKEFQDLSRFVQRASSFLSGNELIRFNASVDTAKSKLESFANQYRSLLEVGTLSEELSRLRNFEISDPDQLKTWNSEYQLFVANTHRAASEAQILSDRVRAIQTANSSRESLMGITGNPTILNSTSTNVQNIVQQATKLESEYQSLIKTISDPNISVDEYDKLIAKLNSLQSEFQDVMKIAQRTTSFLFGDELIKFNASVDTARKKLENFGNQNSVLFKNKGLSEQFEYLKNFDISDPEQLKVWNKEYQSFVANTRAAASEMRILSDRLGAVQTINSHWKQLAQFTASSNVVRSTSASVQSVLREATILEDEYQSLLRSISNPDISTEEYDRLIVKLNGLESEFQDVIKSAEWANSFLDGDGFVKFNASVDVAKKKLESFANQNRSLLSADGLFQQLEKLRNFDISDPEQLEVWNKEYQSFVENTRLVASETKILSDRIKAVQTINSNWKSLVGITENSKIIESTSANVQGVLQQANVLEAEYESLLKRISDPNISVEEYDQLILKLDGLESEFQEVMKSAQKMTGFLSGDELTKFNASVSTARARLEEFGKQNSALFKNKGLTEQFEYLKNFDISDPEQLKVWNKEYQSFVANTRAAGAATKTFGQNLTSNVSKFSEWFFIGGVVSSATQQIRNMISAVTDLDASLTELRKVSDLTGSSLDSFVDEAFDLGSEIGRTGQEVIDATTTFKRAGYDMEESLDLSEAALVMTNVGDNITDTAEAASYLISVLKGFNMDDSEAMGIVDAINETSNKAPIDFDNIAEGLRRVSSTLSQTGSSLGETIGLLTGGFAQLRDIEMVSSGKRQAPYVQKCA